MNSVQLKALWNVGSQLFWFLTFVVSWLTFWPWLLVTVLIGPFLPGPLRNRCLITWGCTDVVFAPKLAMLERGPIGTKYDNASNLN